MIVFSQDAGPVGNRPGFGYVPVWPSPLAAAVCNTGEEIARAVSSATYSDGAAGLPICARDVSAAEEVTLPAPTWGQWRAIAAGVAAARHSKVLGENWGSVTSENFLEHASIVLEAGRHDRHYGRRDGDAAQFGRGCDAVSLWMPLAKSGVHGEKSPEWKLRSILRSLVTSDTGRFAGSSAGALDALHAAAGAVGL